MTELASGVAAGPTEGRFTLGWRPVFLALAVLVSIAALPALGGSFVYDDRLMVGHPLMKGLGDVPGAFFRNSDSYMNAGSRAIGIHGSPTYRPLPMASLILVNALFGARPLIHHVLSLLLHLLAVALLVRLLGGLGGRLTPGQALVATVFALHPASCEAYDWINGRSDVMAGVALLGLATLLLPAARVTPGRGALVWLGLLLLCGALCKETFVVASAAVLAAAALGQPGVRLRRAALLGGLWVAAVLGFFLLRHATLSGPGGAASVDPAAVLRRAPAVLALAAEDLLVPLPRAMLHLSWEIAQPQPVVLLLVPALCLVLFLHRRALGRAALLLGAAATMLPTTLVADSFWMGLDRYLYMPLCLLALIAVVPVVPVVPAVVPAGPGPGRVLRRPLLGMALCAGVALVLTVECHLAARNYRSQRDFADSLVRARPDEPTGYIVVAEEALDHGDRETAARALTLLPRQGLPPVIAHKVVQTDLSAGRMREAMALVEDTAARFPQDPNVLFDLLTLRAGQRRWDEVVRLAVALARDPQRRPAVSALCQRWLADPDLPAEYRGVLQGI